MTRTDATAFENVLHQNVICVILATHSAIGNRSSPLRVLDTKLSGRIAAQNIVVQTTFRAVLRQLRHYSDEPSALFEMRDAQLTRPGAWRRASVFTISSGPRTVGDAPCEFGRTECGR